MELKMKKEMNPISKKIQRIVRSGSITQEQLCVKMGMTFGTFRNIFHLKRRDKLSKYTEVLIRTGLKGLITEDDWKEYFNFRSERRIENERVKKGKSKTKPIMMEDENENESRSFENQCGDESEGNGENFE